MRRLTDAIRNLEGHDDVAILIDQEGGRVARMRPPEWPAFPSGEAFDQLYKLAPSSAIEAARVGDRAAGQSRQKGKDCYEHMGQDYTAAPRVSS